MACNDGVQLRGPQCAEMVFQLRGPCHACRDGVSKKLGES